MLLAFGKESYKSKRVKDVLNLLFQADKDANKGIDFSEFAKLWEAIHGEGEVHILYENEQQIISYSLQIKRLK